MGRQSESVVETPEDSILRGFLSLSGGVLLARLVAFIGTAYLARTLGSYGFGIVGFATALSTFVQFALRHGFEPVGAREVARDPSRASSLAAGVAVLRSGLAGLSILALAAIAFSLDKPFELQLVVVLWSLTLLPQALDPRWTYRGLGRNRWVGVSLVLAQAVYVVGLLLTVRGPQDVVWVPIAMVIGELLAVGYLALPLIRGWNWIVDLTRAWQVLRSSGYLVASGLLAAIIRTVDIVMIAFLLGESEAGVYSAAYRLCFLVMAVAIALQSAYLPRLARAAHHSLERTRALTRRAFEFAAALAVPFTVGGSILAEPLLSHLFGPEYGAGRGALQLLLVGTALFFFNGVMQQLTVAFDRTRPELAIRMLAAALNVALNLLWIPRIGITGAALATLVTDLLVLLLLGLVCRGAGVRIGPQFLWKPLVAAAGMAALMIWMDSSGWYWWLTLAGGAASYIGMLAGLRGLPSDLRS